MKLSKDEARTLLAIVATYKAKIDKDTEATAAEKLRMKHIYDEVSGFTYDTLYTNK